jgi:predicted CXXCH cytochrome family protein
VQAEFVDTVDTTYTSTTQSRHPVPEREVVCADCHTPHRDPDDYPKLLFEWQPDGSRKYYKDEALSEGEIGNSKYVASSTIGNNFCWGCHGDWNNTYINDTYYSETGGDHKTYYVNSPHATDIPTSEWVPSPTYDPTCSITDTTSTAITCLNCHLEHGSDTSTNLIGFRGVPMKGNNLCYQCHSSSSSSYPEEEIDRDSKGYFTTGTYPGSTTYANSPHFISDRFYCANCHNPHGSANEYDMTVVTFTSPAGISVPSAPYNLCFDCHGPHPHGPSADSLECADCHSGHGMQPIANIYKYYVQSTKENAGHPIKTSGGYLDVGDKLPCYDCHNPHEDNAYALRDYFGVTNFDPTSATLVRNFCLHCHVTSDGYDYNDTNINPSTIEGLSRTSGTKLRLPTVSGHAYSDTQSCYTCHGNDYSSIDSYNVHQPGGGESEGGLACNSCHSSIYASMTGGSGYYHPLDSAQATYTAGISNMTCLSCHVDHDIFRPDLNPSGERAMNLRYDNSDTSVTTSSGRNRDFISSETNGGICISCHQSELNKDTYTPTLGVTTVGPIAKTDYASSSHNYEATSTFSRDSSTFYANCLKCHTKEEANSYQNSANKFALHNSNLPRLLLASEESACYSCHDGSEFYGIPGKNPDNIQALFSKTYTHPIATSGTHTSYYDEYTTATAGWMSASSGNRHAECADCHNPHVATNGTHNLGSNSRGNAIKGVWGVEVSYGGTAWTSPTFTKVQSITKEYELCFKCHSSWAWGDDPPDATDPGSYNYTQTDISKEFNPNNLGYHPIIAPGKNQPDPSLNQTNWESGYGISGAWTRTGMSGVAADADYVGLTNTFVPPYGASSLLTCSDCHANDDPSGPQGPHGSTQKWFLKKVDTGITYTRKDGTVVSYGASGGDVNLDLGTNDPNNLCLNCHRADVYGRDNSNGVAVAENLSRFDHESGLRTQRCNVTRNAYGIMCMNCHGGDATGTEGGTGNKLGGIHGSNLGAIDPDNQIPNGSEAIIGERLKNGANWEGHIKGTTSQRGSCFTKDNNDDVSTCRAHGGGRGYDTQVNYDY